MTDSHRIDPERLAALLDGRLSTADAADVRSQLASADEDVLAAFADAAMLTRELAGNAQSTVAPAGVVPLVAARARSSNRRRWFIPAAAAAAALLGYVAWPRDPYAPARFVAELSNNARAADGPVWSATRGAANTHTENVTAAPAGSLLTSATRGTADTHAENVIAVRAGALLTDLQLAASRHESTAERMRALLALMATAPGGRFIVLKSDARTDSGAVIPPAELEDFGRSTMALVGKELCTVGAYLEAARIAAASGDTLFFDKVRAEPVLGVLRRDQSLDPAARAALTTIDSLGRVGAHNAPAMSKAATDLLRALTQ